MTISSIVLLVLVLLAFWLALARQRTALYVVIFLAPWEGLDVDFGLRITAYQIFLGPIVLVTLFRFLYEGIKKPSSPGTSTLALFIVLSVAWSLSQLPFLPDAQVVGGNMRSPLARAITQIVMFLFIISPLFLVPLILRRPDELLLAGKVYLWSVLTLACVGWVQLLVWIGTDINPIPAGLINDLLGGMGDLREEAVARIESMSLEIYRMSSFGGEPKNLGGALVVAMLMIQALLTTTKTPFFKQLISIWMFLAVSTITTLSTTAFFMWVIGTATCLVVPTLFNLKYDRARVYGFQMIGMLLIPIVLLGVCAEAADIPVGDILLARTINRVEESQFGAFEDFDDAILKYLSDHPASAVTGVGLGNIHLYADPYLAPEIAEFAGGGVFVAKAQYLRFVSEIGIIGLGLFLLWYWELIYRTKRWLVNATAQVNLKVLVPFGVASLLMFLAAGNIASQFYLTAGVIAAAHAMRRGMIN